MLGKSDLQKLKILIEGILEGKIIQKRNLNLREEEEYFNINADNIDWEDAIRCTGLYRVKPNPKYEPFINEEECLKECKKHQPFGYVQNSVGNIFNINAFYENKVVIFNTKTLYKDALSTYKFLDGQPFGKQIEE